MQGMTFSQNYLNFFDIQTSTPEKFEKSKDDFVYNMWDFLNHIMDWKHRSKNSKIAESVFSLMTASDLHYHTPVHVLSIFQQARDMDIELEKYEKLAIWFHDVIYNVGSNTNEVNSAMYMMSMLSDALPKEILQKAVYVIHMTADHCKRSEEIEFGHLVLDMDIANLGGPSESYQTASDCVRKEYPQVPLDDFKKARMAFMFKMVEKGYIYRTDAFKQFEEQARKNLGI